MIRRRRPPISPSVAYLDTLGGRSQLTVAPAIDRMAMVLSPVCARCGSTFVPRSARHPCSQLMVPHVRTASRGDLPMVEVEHVRRGDVGRGDAHGVHPRGRSPRRGS